jgi:hypothetical protein
VHCIRPSIAICDSSFIEVVDLQSKRLFFSTVLYAFKKWQVERSKVLYAHWDNIFLYIFDGCMVVIINSPLKVGLSSFLVTNSESSHSYYIYGEWNLFILEGDSSLALLGLFSFWLLSSSSFYSILSCFNLSCL